MPSQTSRQVAGRAGSTKIRRTGECWTVKLVGVDGNDVLIKMSLDEYAVVMSDTPEDRAVPKHWKDWIIECNGTLLEDAIKEMEERYAG